jgi:hypothetical protein
MGWTLVLEFTEVFSRELFMYFHEEQLLKCYLTTFLTGTKGRLDKTTTAFQLGSHKDISAYHDAPLIVDRFTSILIVIKHIRFLFSNLPLNASARPAKT